MNLQDITLFTNCLEAMKTFYQETLGFEVHSEASGFFIQVGDTRLNFYPSETPAFYHFAFNIPSFCIKEAQTWLEERVQLIKDGDKAIIDFVNWNAEALYFKDPAGNIVEFIARKNLAIQTDQSFSINSLLSVSELGIPVLSIKDFFTSLREKTNIEQYWGDLERFCAVGTETGLFIIVGHEKKLWYPTDIPAQAFPFKANFQIHQQKFHMEGDGKKIRIQLLKD